MWWKKNWSLLLLLLLQAILCVIAFNKFWLHMDEYTFMILYDGAKNYYTFQAYMNQSSEHGIWLLTEHAYPYGDYIFYADLTPSIAVPMKLFSMYIYDISDVAIPIFNFIIIFLHFISIVFVYKIVQHFVKTPWILWILTFALTWTNPQFYRLSNGHFNLGISLFIILTILVLIQIYKGYQQNNKAYFYKNKWKLLGLWGLLYIASFSHLYYLPILGITIGFFALFYSIHLKFFEQKSWRVSLKPVLLLGAVCLIGFISVLGTVRLIDSYYTLRAVGNDGYDYDLWKLAISSLFTARPFNTFKYLFSYSQPLNYETNVYLGSYFWYSLTLLLFLRLSTKNHLMNIKEVLKEAPFLSILFGIGSICFFISLGNTYQLFADGYIFNNYLNPFVYLGFITKQVEQFRCLARFFWPAFWIFSLLMAFVIDYHWRKHPKRWVKLSLGVFVLFAVVDISDTIRFQNHTHSTNVYAPKHTACNHPPLKDLDWNKYQAILPLPYFNIGSGIWGFSLDGGHFYNRDIFQITLCTGIPMMSIQSARTPVSHTKDFFSIFMAETPNEYLLEKLNDKPILVLYHKLFHEKMQDFPDYSYPTANPALEALEKGKHLPANKNMVKIAEGDTFIFYEWYPKSQ